jgi:hypothetical protein
LGGLALKLLARIIPTICRSWLRDMSVPPKQTFVTHGEAELQWSVTVPYMGEMIEL